MASKTYTAQEMRDYADAIVGDLWCNNNRGVEYSYDDLIPVVEALRQSADMIEREKKYEYSILYIVDDGSVFHDGRNFDTLDDAKDNVDVCGYDGVKFTRREVGEWEEVEDGE